MQKLLPGFNDPDWSDKIKCFRQSDGQFSGCGATLLVARNDLYVANIHEPMGPRMSLVRFCCFECDTEITVGAVNLFRNLPTRDQWFEENRPKEGFVIELDGQTYFAESELTPVVLAEGGWLRVTLEDALRFSRREAAEAMLKKWELINAYTQVGHFHPKIVRASRAVAAANAR